MLCHQYIVILLLTKSFLWYIMFENSIVMCCTILFGGLMMKRVFKSLLSITLIVAVMVACFVFAPATVVSAAETIVIKADDTVSGNTLTVDIKITNNPGIIALRLYVGYDSSKLTLQNVVDKGVFASKNFSTTYKSPYIMYWNDGATDKNNSSTGTIATLTFKIADGIDDLTGITVSLSTSSANDIIRYTTEVSNLYKESVTPIFTNAVINENCVNGHSYGEWQTDEEKSTDAEIVQYKTCANCNRRIEQTIPAIEKLRFASASLTLQDDLLIKYKVDEKYFTELGYTNPYVVFNSNGKTVTVEEYTVKDNKYIFNFDNIAPDKINDIVYATLYAEHSGNTYASTTLEYSVAQYCYNMLGKYNTDTYKKLRTLWVDILNYGAAAQEYTGHNASNLANANLTETQKAWGTSFERPLQSHLNLKYETISNPKVSWLSGGLNLNESFAIRFKISATDINNLTVKVRNAIGQETIITSDEFKATDGGYYVYFRGYNAAQMSNVAYFTVYEGDTAVSDTVRYSIESYAASKQNDSNAKLAKLVKAMIKYGDSAYNYVN